MPTTRELIRQAGRSGPWHVRNPGLGWRQTDADMFTIGKRTAYLNGRPGPASM
jgi:hypothetical protein